MQQLLTIRLHGSDLHACCRSGPGGQPIAGSWCVPPALRKGNDTPMLLYVGGQPSFDGCMEGICLADAPEQYNVTWVSSFNLDAALASQGSSKALAERSADPFDVIEQLRNSQVSGTLEVIAASLANLGAVIAATGDGWLLGTGAWHDPCLDRQGTINTCIMFGVFFLLATVIVCDYFLQRRTSGGAADSTFVSLLMGGAVRA